MIDYPHRKQLFAIAVFVALLSAAGNIRAQKLIALTFDDGPTLTTKDVLNCLRKYDVPATFFVQGRNLNSRTEPIIREALSLGCEIENHSFSHPKMDTLSTREIKREIRETDRAIKAVTGAKPKYFRPPYGATSRQLFNHVHKTFIMGLWAMDSHPEVPSSYRSWKTIKEARDGGIILLHDFNGNTQTVDALDSIIVTLQDNGFEFVTVEDLFARKGIRIKKYFIYSNVLQELESFTVPQEFENK